MKYRFCTKFWYDEDDAALALRLAAFFRNPFFVDAVLKPRSRKLAPTEENVTELLAPTDDYLSSDFDWVVKRQDKPITGRLVITRNRICTPPGFTSSLKLRFSLSDDYNGGPFRNAEEVCDAALACMLVGPSLVGVVQCEDEAYESVSAKFEWFREIDDMAVPVSIEWVTVLHQDILTNMAVDLRRAEKVTGVRVGRTGDYWWVVLCPEPFSFASGVGEETLEQVSEELGLKQIHSRFKRTKT